MSRETNPGNQKRAQTQLDAGNTLTAVLASSLVLALLFLFWRSAANAPLEPSTTTIIEFVLTTLVIIALNGLFVAGDTAIDVLKNSHEKALDEDEEAKHVVFRDLMARKANFVAACSLGSMTMRAWLVALAVIPGVAFADWLSELSPVFRSWNDTSAYGHGLVVFLAVLLLAIPLVAVNIVLGELIPRSYAAVHPLATGLRLYGAVRLFNAIFSAPIAVFMWLAGLVTRRFGARATFAVANQAEDEIIELLEEAEETGEIEVEEREMVASVFEFGDTVAREVMTPRANLEALPIDTDLKTVVKVVEDSGHSRIPVYEGTDDLILGIVHAKDVLSALMEGEMHKPLRELLRPALFVPEGKPLHDLLVEMRQSKTQIAIVQDEHSGTAGIVTIEDIVEEVMGEIVDEYDEDLPKIVRKGGGFVSDGMLHLEDVNDAIGAELESEEFDTIGGYVFGLFGRQPSTGESVVGEGFRFTVIETDGKRIMRLGIERVAESGAHH